jgi:uncharacterized protein (TIGR02271 family)
MGAEMANEAEDLVVPLSGLDFASAKEHPDARGWTVMAANGIATGHVSDLLIDTRTAEVHAFVVELSGNSDLGSGAYQVLVPAEQARMEPTERKVHLHSLSWTDVALLPAYGERPEPQARSDDTVIVEPPAAVPPAVSKDVRMTLFEEELSVGTRTVAAGEAVIGKRVETEQVREVVPIMHEDVLVERRPIPPGVGLEPRTEGDVTYIPLVQEELVIEKRLVAREELVVRKRQVVEEQVVEESLRKEVPDIRREGAPDRPE